MKASNNNNSYTDFASNRKTISIFDYKNYNVNQYSNPLLSNKNNERNIFNSYEKPESITYKYKTINISVPSELSTIVELLKRKENILLLADNWDGEGSEAYLFETWNVMVTFILSYSESIYSEFGYVIDLPKIYPSDSGSIDIDWENDDYGYIINIAKYGKKATYYADNKGNQMTEGVFNPFDFNINLLPKAISL